MAQDGHFRVEVVVGEVHHILGLLNGQVVRPLRDAGEVLVHRVKGSLPHVAELINPPRVGRLVGHIIQQKDHAGIEDDHLGQGGPGGQVHGLVGRSVNVVQDARRVDVVYVQVRRRVIAVLEQDCDNVKTVGRNPVLDFGEPVCDGASVEDVARGMAEVRDAVVGIPVHLTLKKPHTVVELLRHIQGLVGGEVSRPHEGRVVASHHGDVAVFAVAQLYIVVAGLGVDHSWGRGS